MSRVIAVGGIVCLLCGSCGRRGELLGTINASGDAGATDVVGPQTPRFTAPQLVVALANPLTQDGDPTMTGDLLELFFMSDRNGGADIWTSQRATATAPWGAPRIVPELNSAFGDYGPAVSIDGLRIWISTDRDLSPGRIWQSSRTSRSAAWGPPVAVPELANTPGGPAKDFGAAVDATDTIIMFGSNRLGAAGFDIFSAGRPTAGAAWDVPKLVPGVNGPMDDWDPFVAQGGLVIFITSLRQGAGDIFWSQRHSTTEPFPPPTPLVDINSASYDSDPDLSVDLTYMLFDSSRSGDTEIYEAYAVR